MRNVVGWTLAVAWGAGAVVAVGQEREALLFTDPRVGQQQVRTRYQSTGYFNANVADQGEKFHLVRHDFRMAVPLFQDDTNEWVLHGRVKALDTDTGARLPRSFRAFPDSLWDVRVGASYRHKFDNGWIAGGLVEVGSASDRPFHSADEWLVNANAFLRIPHVEDNAWLFYLNYANAREFWPNIPIPGFGYQFNLKDQLRGLVGVPFNQVVWEPLAGLTLEASYFPARTISAEIGYRIVKQVRLYAGFDWTNERFFRAGRQHTDHRLNYYEKRVMAGVRWDIVKNLWLDFGAGFAWDRSFFEAESYADRADNRIEISDAPMLKLQVGVQL